MLYRIVPGQIEVIALPSDRTPGGFIYSFMSADNSVSLNTDAAGSVITFSYTVPAGRRAHISRMNMVIFDAGQRPSLFGGIASLTTGCRLISIDSAGAETFDFCNGQEIKTNADFAFLSGIDNETDTAPADDARYIRWTIEKAGHPLLLEETEGICMVIQDDLTGLDDFKILVQGVLLPV